MKVNSIPSQALCADSRSLAERTKRGAKKRGEKIAIAGEGVQRKTVHDGALIGARDCGAQPEVVDSE